MDYTKTIVCLANSRKTTGRCIAGKQWQSGKPGEWVRPVSMRSTHEISEEELRYEDGSNPQLLDILKVPCNAPQPTNHQHENHVIDQDYYWVKVGTLPWENIQPCLDNPNTLWGVGEGSYAGINNRIVVGQEDGISLYLISVEKLQLLVGIKSPEFADSKRAVRGKFIYRGVKYQMDVTDPLIERSYLRQTDGQYNIPHPILCISLGDPYQGYFYKLIAGVLYPERFKENS